MRCRGAARRAQRCRLGTRSDTHPARRRFGRRQSSAGDRAAAARQRRSGNTNIGHRLPGLRQPLRHARAIRSSPPATCWRARRWRFYWSVYVPHRGGSRASARSLRADLTGLPPVLIQLAELDVLRSRKARRSRRGCGKPAVRSGARNLSGRITRFPACLPTACRRRGTRWRRQGMATPRSRISAGLRRSPYCRGGSHIGPRECRNGVRSSRHQLQRMLYDAGAIGRPRRGFGTSGPDPREPYVRYAPTSLLSRDRAGHDVLTGQTFASFAAEGPRTTAMDRASCELSKNTARSAPRSCAAGNPARRSGSDCT